MNKIAKFICKNKIAIIIISLILLVLSFIGMKLTKVNYDILVYLPSDIETIKGQNILTDDFNIGGYSFVVIDDMSSKDILKYEKEIKNIDGVSGVASLYDLLGTTIPVEALPEDISSRLHEDNTDIMVVLFSDSTSSEKTMNAVKEIRNLTDGKINQGGMSSMVLDTRELSEKEIAIYIVIAVILCIVVLELSLDSYIVPFILLGNIGAAILYNLGTNIFLGQISYITKALVAVLQLGVTTDFSIFLYHAYESNKDKYSSKEEAMINAIKSTFTSVTGSSLTTIVGFLALCAMNLTLGKDLGIVMAKGVLLGVVTVLTLFPSLLLVFDKAIDKTKHKVLIPSFHKLNKFIINHHKIIFGLFIILLVPAYLAYSKVDVYYKLDSSLPETLESVKTNNYLKEHYNIVSPEIILVDKNLKSSTIDEMVSKIKELDGIDFVLTYNDLSKNGLTENMLSSDITKYFESDDYELIIVNSLYDIATDELNEQTDSLNTIVKSYDSKAIVAGEGPLMKDLVSISDEDFNNVNILSIACIFIVLFFVLRSVSLPVLLITAIEFAIFANMGVSYFSGTVLPFIAPIVLGTIQLGATIDYAILTTTTYLRNRKDGLDKKEAMQKTMDYCGQSILISGLCFFAATFGVGVYSDISMIGSICTLISRGAIISVIVVITVLPSILLIFDKLIIKTTLNCKEVTKMNKNVKKVTIGLIVGGLLLVGIPTNTYALTKNETVYSKLNTDGTTVSTLVNEVLLNTSEEDTISDYSELENIVNINDDREYKINNKYLTWSADKKDIYYQGTTEKELPVSVKVSYKLDGNTISLDDLLGKSGNVTITLKYTNTDKHGDLYTPFVVAAGTMFDTDTNSNITVNNGKVITTGTNNVVAGIAAPGLYESLGLDALSGIDTISINLDTTNFKLPTIYSAVTPKVLESSDLDIFNKLSTVYDSVNALQENMDAIEEGSNKVAAGSTTLKNAVASSIGSLDASSNALTDEQITYITNSAVEKVNETYTDEYSAAIGNAAVEQIKQSDSYQQIAAGIAQLEAAGVTSTLVSVCTSENIPVAYLNTCSTYSAYITKYSTLVQAETIMEQTAYNVAIATSKQTAAAVASSVAPEVASSVANSVKSEAVKSISSSLNALYNGISELDNGIQTLNSGIETYNNEGISVLSDTINNTVKPVQNKIERLTALGEEYTSFGGSNTKGTTKFILVIDGKEKEVETKTTTTKTTKTSLWTRIVNLFK